MIRVTHELAEGLRMQSSKTLILYYNGTFIHRQNGAHVRVMSLLDFLSTRANTIIVYSYADHPDCPWSDEEIRLFKTRFPQIELVLDTQSSSLRFMVRLKKLLSMVAPALCGFLLQWMVRSAAPNFKKMCEANPDAVLLINYANGMFELNGFSKRIVILETHDLDFIQFSKRFGYPLTSMRIAGRIRSELALLDRASALVSIALPETGLFRLCFPEKQIFFIPDYGIPAPKPEARSVEPDCDMVFVGSDNPFNVDGICRFIEDHRDWLTDRTLLIAGRVSLSDRVRRAAEDIAGISLLGFVDDLDPIYGRAKCAICPVDGTGLKIKAIEACAAGKPVFASQHTIDGFPPGSEGCIFPIATATMTELLSSPSAQQRAADAARHFAESLKSSPEVQRFETYLAGVGVCRFDGSVQGDHRGGTCVPKGGVATAGGRA